MKESPPLPLTAATGGAFLTLASPESGDIFQRDQNAPPRTEKSVALLWNKNVPGSYLHYIAPSDTLTRLELPSVRDEVYHHFNCFLYEYNQPYLRNLRIRIRISRLHGNFLLSSSSAGNHDFRPGPDFLHFNDSTFSRRLHNRPSSSGCALAGTLREYVPPEATESNNLQCIQEIPLSGDLVGDFAQRLPFGKNLYDKVILDVNSVGEQILPKRQDTNPIETTYGIKKRYGIAYAYLLLAALTAVRVGGRVVYCAPSTAGDEHDHIVDLALHYTEGMAHAGSQPWAAGVKSLPDLLTEKLKNMLAKQTKRGWLVLPNEVEDGDRQFGPLYIAVLKKRPARPGAIHRVASGFE
jgi:hypothetical protein